LEAFPTDTKAINIRESDSDINLFIEPLSNRELEVLSLIAEGCTNQEIAQELYLSLYTIKSHARNIYSKLGVKNRTEAVAKARLFGLLPQDQVST
jgi:LuxR family maltose regulon positive regulatory protein